MATPIARLIVPHPNLASCVPGYLARSTLDCETQGGRGGRGGRGGYNHYPATPLCAVAWMLDGRAQMVVGDCLDAGLGKPGDVIFAGPQNAPYSTYNEGPARMFAALFYPDAMHALLGRDLSGYVDQFFRAEDVPGPDWASLFPALHAAPDDDARARLVDAFLQPRWAAVRADGGGERASLVDWSRHLAVRAATSSLGRSVRNAERRVRAWAGLPMRTLNRLGRAEQVLALARANHERGTLSWADVAAGAGYADQAHLSRETRAITGRTPTELAHAIQHDDSYWLYRIWS